MAFLDPTTDIAFKKLFGDQAKKEILISFLNSVLQRPDGEKIVEVTITNPYNDPPNEWLKLSVVDVRCVDQQKRNYIVEVQVDPQDDYAERSQYYASLAIARQLKVKGKYHTLMPVIFIGILSRTHFQDPHFLSQYCILNTKTHTHELKLLEFYFIELEKFNKTLESLDSVIDKWIFLLKNASEFNSIPKELKTPVELEEAMEALKEGNLSPEELDAYDRIVDARRVAESVLETHMRIGLETGLKKGLKKGLQEGRQKGLQEGLQEGIERGLQKGIEKGKHTTQHDIARKLLARGVTIEIIAEDTGLSVEAIKLLLKNE